MNLEIHPTHFDLCGWLGLYVEMMSLLSGEPWLADSASGLDLK